MLANQVIMNCLLKIRESVGADVEVYTPADVVISSSGTRHASDYKTVLRQLEGDSNAIIVKPGDASYETFKTMIEEALGADPKSVPYVIVADKAGNVYYFSQGYNTVLRDGIDRVFPKIH